jgi:hypothetical protein
VGGICSKLGEVRNTYKLLGRKPEGKRPFGKTYSSIGGYN